MSWPSVFDMTNIVLKTEVTGSGPGILLAHGAGGGIAANFAPLIPALAADHTVVASDYPADDTVLDLDALADALVAAAVDNGVQTFTVVGYSLGTAVAVRAAVRHPDRVRGLVLTAGFAVADHRLRLLGDLWAGTIEQGSNQLFADFALTAGYSAAYLNSLSRTEVDEFTAFLAANIPGGAVAQVRLAQSVDTTADLPRISVPTRIISTTADLLVDPANSRALAAAIPGADYVEIATGHVPMIERPGEWTRLTTDFLAAHQL